MIVEIKFNVPHIIRSVPETEIKGNWLKEEILRVIDVLHEVGFNVRGVDVITIHVMFQLSAK